MGIQGRGEGRRTPQPQRGQDRTGWWQQVPSLPGREGHWDSGKRLPLLSDFKG